MLAVPLAFLVNRWSRWRFVTIGPAKVLFPWVFRSFFFVLFSASLADADDVTIEDAVDRAFASYPQLEASEALVEAETERTKRASNWDNPSVSFEAENIGGDGAYSGTDSAEYTVSLEQPIQIGGRAEARQGLARVELSRAKLTNTLTALSLKAEVYRRFARLLYSQAVSNLAEERWASVQRTAEVVDAQQRSGSAAGLDRTRSDVSVSLATVEKERAAMNLEKSRAALASMWEESAPDFETALGSLKSLPPAVDEADLNQKLTASPWSQLSKLPVEARIEALRLAKASRWPEASAVLGHRWFEADDSDAWVAGVSVSLPVWDRPRSAIRLATAEHRQAEAEARANDRELRDKLRTAISTLTVSRQAASKLSEETLPRAEESYALVEEGYRLGRYDLLYLLEARRTLFDLRALYLDTLLECHLAQADLVELFDLSLTHLNSISDRP